LSKNRKIRKKSSKIVIFVYTFVEGPKKGPEIGVFENNHSARDGKGIFWSPYERILRATPKMAFLRFFEHFLIKIDVFYKKL
jgi:hypothetical protein